MFKAMGQTVVYHGNEIKVRWFAPASKVNCGCGFAVLLVVDGQSIYVNTKELSN